MHHQTVMRLRKECVAVCIVGLLVFILGMVLMFTAGRGSPAQPAGAAVAMVGAVEAVLACLPILLTSRCPFCRKWVHPWYYPRRGVHCPHCGKTSDQ
jgi:hypothetical protein